MVPEETRSGSRRAFLGALMSFPASLVIGAVPGARGQARMAPTPACGEPGGVTPPQTEGPYWKPSSPQRASLLEPGMAGTRLVVEGLVLATDCRPIAGAVIDVWQADDEGRYDNAGYRLRGHQVATAAGRYRVETIVPGVYPGRTRHIHVKVQAPGRPPITTQLYFPGEPGNQRDGIFDPRLVMKVADAPTGRLAVFDFVLDPGGPVARRS